MYGYNLEEEFGSSEVYFVEMNILQTEYSSCNLL
jgi:hypothetical protein